MQRRPVKTKEIWYQPHAERHLKSYAADCTCAASTNHIKANERKNDDWGENNRVDEDRRSNFSDAVEAQRRKREVTLECAKHCGAANRPGATIIDLDRDGLAVCGCCGHHWRVAIGERSQ